jgi:hypothetical protein
VESTVETASPSSFVSSVLVVTMPPVPTARARSTWTVAVISSPATMGRWWVKRSSAWTTREKSIPEAGSEM